MKGEKKKNIICKSVVSELDSQKEKSYISLNNWPLSCFEFDNDGHKQNYLIWCSRLEVMRVYTHSCDYFLYIKE